MAEWSIAPVLKTGVWATGPWVRISPPPHQRKSRAYCSAFSLTCGCKVVNWTAPVYGDSNTGSRFLIWRTQWGIETVTESELASSCLGLTSSASKEKPEFHAQVFLLTARNESKWPASLAEIRGAERYEASKPNREQRPASPTSDGEEGLVGESHLLRQQ